MGNSPGDDANNDGVNDKTGKNIFGGTNTKMTDEERAALDQEIMDLLDEEAQEKGMYSNDAEASGDFASGKSTNDYEDDAFDDFPNVGGTSGGGSYKDNIPDSE